MFGLQAGSGSVTGTKSERQRRKKTKRGDSNRGVSSGGRNAACGTLYSKKKLRIKAIKNLLLSNHS
jgi:hypothetical protein